MISKVRVWGLFVKSDEIRTGERRYEKTRNGVHVFKYCFAYKYRDCCFSSITNGFAGDRQNNGCGRNDFGEE